MLQNTSTDVECDATYTADDCTDSDCPWLSHTPAAPNDGSDGTPPIWDDFVCLADMATDGCAHEQPLEATLAALTVQAEAGMPNEGFLRDDSILAVIYIAEEDDCSTSNIELFNPARDDFGPMNLRCARNTDELHPIERYHDALLDLRGGDATRVIIGVIGGLPLGGGWTYGDDIDGLRELVEINPDQPSTLLPSCNTAVGAASPPVRLVELAYSFGITGMASSICETSWMTVLDHVAETITDSL